ncbi:MAG: tRNA preQ1(34) S-adenosylmethionine ribosyltransferase-isomerase QueA [Armatimonadota bacterium]
MSDFDYELPPERIAQHPADRREASRLLDLDRRTGEIVHRSFPEVVELLAPGDLLVVNDTRVIPARLVGTRPTGGRVELLLLEQVAEGRWQALGRPGRALRVGSIALFGDGQLTARVVGQGPQSLRTVELEHEGELLPLLERIGLPPLPPYITREPEATDRERYQTVYARHPGAVAAPTAGLHFSQELLEAVRARGVEVGRVTLHVGLGTFQPVRARRVEEHVMHPEQYEVSAELVALANRRRGRLVAVGTTVVRALETVADEQGRLHPGSGRTALFIHPGYRFRAVEALLTNFHLPRSTLLVMVAAFAGRERVLAAYREALEQGYRFYSYGDAMFIH